MRRASADGRNRSSFPLRRRRTYGPQRRAFGPPEAGPAALQRRTFGLHPVRLIRHFKGDTPLHRRAGLETLPKGLRPSGLPGGGRRAVDADVRILVRSSDAKGLVARTGVRNKRVASGDATMADTGGLKSWGTHYRDLSKMAACSSGLAAVVPASGCIGDSGAGVTFRNATSQTVVVYEEGRPMFSGGIPAENPPTWPCLSGIGMNTRPPWMRTDNLSGRRTLRGTSLKR